MKLSMRKDEDRNKVLQLSDGTYYFIPRMKFFKTTNLASKIHKSKKFKSRKRLKQDFLKEIKDYLW